ncbi:MAG: RsmG family class I SAM-dependent methyltransferase [candidate division Zixibacteria bacterium]|nr:RsmG family class I SAM-dependent methyltransferase [candidate division Zixibacteria bacterium]
MRMDSDNHLQHYFAKLTEENRRINLVSRETIADRLPQLAAESLAPLEILHRPHFNRYLDIGSGGGFPAIPILLTRNIEHVTLVERTQKKASALRRILISMNLRADIIPVTFEQFIPSDSGGYDIITMRLVKLTKSLLRRILPLLSTGGVFVYYAQTDIDSTEDSITTTSAVFQNEQNESKYITFFYRS